MAIYRGTGGSSTTTDETTINAVNQKAAEAATSASNAASSASSAATSASNAGSSATSANTSATTATTAATQASASKDAAALSATNAAASKLAAENAKTAAEAAETNAILYGNMANTAASDAADSQAFAEAARDTAETYATQVETNKDAAATSAAAALVSETNAAASETAAASSESNAASSEIAAAASAIAADASANDAATSEANAAASEAGVAADAATATTAAANALTSETNAATSEANAATSETNAATSESNAASSASSAATSATASASSAADALSSANAAELSAANAATLLDNFDDRYLGPKSAAPATDNDGDPLIVGALYFDTTTGKMNVFTASGWLETGQAILALMEKFYFTATEGQTVFTGADDEGSTLSITVDSEMVTLNGVILESTTDYTVASGSITLASGATAGDELNVISFNNFQLADAVSRTLGGTFEDDITVNGDVTATAFFGDGSNLTGVDAFPDQTGNSGRFLTTNGTTASWGVVDTTNGDTAYSWGDHSLAGYADAATVTTALDGKVDDAQVLTNVPAGAVFTDTTYSVGNGGLTEINFTSARSSKLDGIEAGATADQTITAGSGLSGGGTGNVTLSHADTSAQASVNNSGTTFIQDITLDTYGHITGIGSASVTIPDFVPSGTAMLFQQTSAPTGWTKSTTHNDKALRVVSGTASSGGSTAMSTALGTPSVSGTVGISGAPAVGNLAVSMSGNVAVGNTTLSVNTIPSHSHSGSTRANNQGAFSGSGYYHNNSGTNTGNRGNNGAHGHSASHNLSGVLNGAPSVGNLAGSLSSATAAINVQYVDIIIATKD